MGLCLLGYVSHRVEIGCDRGLLRTDLLGVKKKKKDNKRLTQDVLERRVVIGEWLGD
jgi:hypothetical protein